MPLAHIEAEQLEASRWTLEIEAGGQPGGPPFKRCHASAYSLEEIIEHIRRIYAEQVPGGVTVAKSLAQEGTMTDDKNPNQRPNQEPVQRSPGDQRADVNNEDRSAEQPESLPDEIRPDQRIPGPGGTFSADNKGLAPIPPTEPGQKNPGDRMSDEEIEEVKEEAEEEKIEEDENARPDSSNATPPRSDQRTPAEEKRYQEQRQQQQKMDEMKRQETERRDLDERKRLQEAKRAEERKAGQQADPHHTAPRSRDKDKLPELKDRK